ncbi:hypothetical protein [Providencia heimbachae]|uniref:hypothetical protein n=1 Tax=Providencia heimbachae TaxID=333962 RepID=UPI0008382706|nr:hypothetical protein [Providencia heimbachae]NIH21831.1 hypothetical protein [Providencia heimbachae]NIH23411.1 hypothetical protein [Providencia heimbachae]
MQGTNPTNDIQLEVLYMGKDEVYVCFIEGPATIDELQKIETQLQADAEEYEILTEHGKYKISATYDRGDYDDLGRCEVEPYWVFDIQSFEPMPEEYYAGN